MEVFCKTFTLAQRRCFSVNFAGFLRAVFKLFMTVYVAYANAMYIAFSRLKLLWYQLAMKNYRVVYCSTGIFHIFEICFIFTCCIFCHRFLWIYSYHSAGSNVPAQSLNNITIHYNYKKITLQLSAITIIKKRKSKILTMVIFKIFAKVFKNTRSSRDSFSKECKEYFIEWLSGGGNTVSSRIGLSVGVSSL